MKLYEELVITGERAMVPSHGKINLTLDVLGRRENGYHDVEMIMQTVSLFDLVITDRTPKGIRLSCNYKFLPTNEKNIAYKAAKLFFETTQIKGGAKILIHKNIPVAAGLAGGSGNGAAVLCSLNALYGMPLSWEELQTLSLKLGADVPYCICGGTALAAGIGEILTPLPALARCVILLVKPPINVSTALIYEKIDAYPIARHPDTKAVIECIRNEDLQGVCDGLFNVMEPITATVHPAIPGIKEKMLKDGALGAVMSGSGPTVFGIFQDMETAKVCADSFSKQYKDVFLCHSF